MWKTSLLTLSSSPTSLHLNVAKVAALPGECSRHNTTSRAHALTKTVERCSTGLDEVFVVSNASH